MAHGFLVLNLDDRFSEEYTNTYLELRAKLFNIAKTYPEWVIPRGVDPVHKIKRVQLSNAHLGLLRTYEDAEKMVQELRQVFPGVRLEIIIVENDQAESVRFYRNG